MAGRIPLLSFHGGQDKATRRPKGALFVQCCIPRISYNLITNFPHSHRIISFTDSDNKTDKSEVGDTTTCAK